ncbi:sialate O-acetylesterase [Paenibacillus sp. CF384]|uniref:sialate O-acetylesterase n=1 Tax=Paenibacillus sp. CF384 TaxID=1884382 RepID=UPI00089C2F29|nr:sialate O-acetylesterase [Paenibacillus sp. CF384]SDW05899.1 sialate O-acetylesterase [Paenibacillus sp. CF384]
MDNPAVYLKIVEPVPHQVVQRDEGDVGIIPITLNLTAVGFPESSLGRVEARIIGTSSVGAWRPLGLVEGDLFSGALTNVPVGEHVVEIRIVTVTDEADAEQEQARSYVTPVFVGDLWILAGQSNMDGVGKLGDIQHPETGISCFYMGDRWDVATDPLCWLLESVDPINWEVPEAELTRAILEQRQFRQHGAGLGIPFAKEIRQHVQVPIGLIVCSHSGTSMAHWDYRLADKGGHSFYGAMLRRVNKLGGKVKGCLWYQGESDTGAETAPLYYETMVSWVAALRKDLYDPQLPIIYAQLSVFYVLEPDARWPDPALWNRVQADQLALEHAIPYTAMVPTIDADLADIIHLDTESLQQVGRRMAWQALRIAYGTPISETGPRPALFGWNVGRTELTIAMTGINGHLKDVGCVCGFRVEKENRRFPFTAEITEDRLRIRLRFEQSVPVDSQLSHGAGFNPAVNVKDGLGIPLVVFGPVTV